MRDVALPGGPGTMALITMDNGFDHTKPTTFGPSGLLGLQRALDGVQARAEAGEIVAVGLTGKPFVFAVGADLKDVGGLGSRDQALTIARFGHEQRAGSPSLPAPSFAFVNGAAMGGGVEIALHCTYRTIAPACRRSRCPRCSSGWCPAGAAPTCCRTSSGSSGPRRLVLQNPLNQNRMINGVQASRLGLADALFEPADFLARSLAWAGAVLRGEQVVERTDVDRDEQAWETALTAVRREADQRTGRAALAPYRAIELLRAARTDDRDTGFAREDDALADLIVSDEFRAGVYAFDLVQRRAKRPAGAPDRDLARRVTAVGVVGAGLMASRLALLLVRRLEVPVLITDLDQTRVDQGVGWVHAEPAAARREAAAERRQGRPVPVAGHRLDVEGRVRRRRPRGRGGVRGACRSSSRCWRRSRPSCRRSACSPPTPRRCRSPRWRRGCSTPSGSSGSTSSTRWR
ncbi:hypothetical protein GCM10025868_05100 [Angustibacter aerolatus]|uniref:3-hydroxyacyl-CoA dehydrogenase n=1 Tax=Angustibacter aerolatus TaxID=1162965 RepID=A0ABQ6JAR4_9ACTN|nr:hypothetical protein GCM10025868_05100 [Angustibacter aerolatus]